MQTFTKFQMRNAMLAMMALALYGQPTLAAPAKTGSAKIAPKPTEKPAVNQPVAAALGDPQKFVEGLYNRLNELSKATETLEQLHAKISGELNGVVDYPEMAKLTLGEAKWTEITAEQKSTFTDLLKRMVSNTYVRKFKPGQAIVITYGGTRKLEGAKVEVQSTIAVGKSSADVHYKMQPIAGKWMVYDILVDEASQVVTYRNSFKKILDREGWGGLMTRMKKAAEKKIS